MANDVAPISLAGSKLDDARHGCAFFNADDEECRLRLPLIRQHFSRRAVSRRHEAKA